MCLCAGSSGGAAHGAQRHVAAAAEAERPARAGAAAGSGEELSRGGFVLLLLISCHVSPLPVVGVHIKH